MPVIIETARDDADRFPLLHGPYRSPQCRLGEKLFCERCGWVPVRPMSDRRIVWPMTSNKRHGRPFLIICGDLAKAVKRESAIAVCHWWCVTPQTVTVWRKALGAGQYTEGTLRLDRDWTPERLPPKARAKALANAARPEAIARRAASRRGRAFHPSAAAALTKFNGGRRWTEEEDRLLGILPDRVVAERTGHSIAGVRTRGISWASRWLQWDETEMQAMKRLKQMMKWLFGILFILAGGNHFVQPDLYVKIMPPYLPWPRALVAGSGAAEVIMGILVLIPTCTVLAAWGLIALLVAVFPANLHMALNADWFSEFPPVALWVRLPLQGVLIAWAYWLTRKQQ